MWKQGEETSEPQLFFVFTHSYVADLEEKKKDVTHINQNKRWLAQGYLLT